MKIIIQAYLERLLRSAAVVREFNTWMAGVGCGFNL